MQRILYVIYGTIIGHRVRYVLQQFSKFHRHDVEYISLRIPFHYIDGLTNDSVPYYHRNDDVTMYSMKSREVFFFLF